MSGSSHVEAFKAAAGVPKVPRRRKRPPPFSIRFTDEERTRLEREAGRMALAAYIRHKLLGEDAADRRPQSRRKQRRPTIDHETVARLLGTLGQSELARSMIAIALAAQSGALPVTPELSDRLDTACDDIAEMRTALIAALGVKPGDPSSCAKASED